MELIAAGFSPLRAGVLVAHFTVTVGILSRHSRRYGRFPLWQALSMFGESRFCLAVNRNAPGALNHGLKPAQQGPPLIMRARTETKLARHYCSICNCQVARFDPEAIADPNDPARRIHIGCAKRRERRSRALGGRRGRPESEAKRVSSARGR